VVVESSPNEDQRVVTTVDDLMQRLETHVLVQIA
jgi:hypothetical protein